MATKLKNVSILTAGEAKGHNLLIDETSLQQALAVAQSMGRIKVTNGHGAQQVMDILGYVENFRIEGSRLLGDLTLLNSDKADYVANLAGLMPDQFGLSLTFSGVPEDRAGERFARVTEIYDVSVVTQPAANPAGMFSAFSRLPVDTFSKPQMDTPIVETKKEELSAPAPVALLKLLLHFYRLTPIYFWPTLPTPDTKYTIPPKRFQTRITANAVSEIATACAAGTP